MSILIAITGSDSALVATDSRRIESDGTIRDNFPKTFRLRKDHVIGGHTGLLEFSGRTVPAWLNSLPDDCFVSMDALVAGSKALFEDEMSKIDEKEVIFDQRRADIVIVGTSDLKDEKSQPCIRAIVLRPELATRRVTSEIRSFNGYCAAGDDAAIKAVLGRMKVLRPQTLPRKRLTTAAMNIIAVGVQKAGVSASFPTVSSCGGPASLTFL